MKLTAMSDAHLLQIAYIEAEVNPAPWTTGLLAMQLKKQPYAVVLLDEQKVVGYLLATTAFEQTEILILGVHSDYRRQGLATQLLTDLQQQTDESSDYLLEVRASNKGAIALYKQLGFTQIGVRKDYYDCRSGKEDALILQKLVPPSS